MKFRHLHSIKEVPYGLFTLHVQLDFTIGVKKKEVFLSFFFPTMERPHHILTSTYSMHFTQLAQIQDLAPFFIR